MSVTAKKLPELDEPPTKQARIVEPARTLFAKNGYQLTLMDAAAAAVTPFLAGHHTSSRPVDLPVR